MNTSMSARERSDLWSAITLGAVIVGLLAFDSVRRIVQMFAAPGAITVVAPVDAQPITADIGVGAPATVHEATLVVEGVNAISILSFVVSIVVTAGFLIAATVLAVLISRRLMRGIVFDRKNTGMLSWMSLAILAASLVGPFFENMGLNGVFAALDDDFSGQWELFLARVPLYVTAIAIGTLVIVFQRGAALQRETEGLV